jgi:hypothetical protein
VTEEVRVAMALNGGVSLAVWMGGVAVEFDCARRAHLGVEPASASGAVPERSVYHTLCSAFSRKLVLDILCGASAGGVNGSLLAAVMVAARRLPAGYLRTKWLDIGDFEKLLRPTSETEPKSILRGDLFREQLLEAFHALRGTNQAKKADLDQTEVPSTQEALRPFLPALDVTMTNVLGEYVGFTDEWDERLFALEYRAPFCFREEEDFDPASLATAARASASFPVAFEPTKVDGRSTTLAKLSGSVRYAIDGGLLENAPVKYALDLIPTRRASEQVKRYVCYVNAAPPRYLEQPASANEPSLTKVIGYVVNLPRDGRFVDQLYALRDATRRARFNRLTQDSLLGLDLDSLRATANALLDPYRRRRFLLSLEELFDDPGDAQRAVRNLVKPDKPLPDVVWIPGPGELTPPSDPTTWQWGIRAAQRVLHLELDLLRRLLKVAGDESTRLRILKVRTNLDDASERLEILRRRSPLDPDFRKELKKLADAAEYNRLVAELNRRAALDQCAIGLVLRDATKRFIDLLRALAPTLDQDSSLAKTLSGLGGENATVDGFLLRALAIEVVRRAFSTDEDIATGETLLFAQLTPVVGVRIFSAKPFTGPFPDSGEDKLTGIRLGHFAGFYRRSWRANDFMWGRLDAAARIVDLLVDVGRADEIASANPWSALIRIVLPDEDPDDLHARLVEEALDDAQHPDANVSADVVKAITSFSDAGLPAQLAAALEADLRDKDGKALFTRVVCARAAQLEILREELPYLDEESKGDWKVGCFTNPLKLDVGSPAAPAPAAKIWGAIEKMRSWWDGQPDSETLPQRLGRDSGDERVSDLALRTVAHAMFVSLASVRRTSVLLGRVVAIARVPILPIAGVVSRTWWIRFFGVVVGFGAAAFYVAARLITTDAGKSAPLGSVWSPRVLLTWAAAVAVLAVAAVPGLRAREAAREAFGNRGQGLRSFFTWRGLRSFFPSLWRGLRSFVASRAVQQAFWALGLFALGGALAVVLAASAGRLGIAQLLANPGSINPAKWAALLALGLVVGGAPAVRGLLPGGLGGIATRFLRWLHPALLLFSASAVITYWSAPPLWHAIWLHADYDAIWQITTAWSAVASVVFCFLYLLLGRR